MKGAITLGVGVLALAGMTLPSAAADLPTKAPMMVPPPLSWNGCYLGANAGGVWGDSKFTWVANPVGFGGPAAINAGGTNKINETGFTGGGQIGCNWQMGVFVLGGEADINYTDIDKSIGVVIPPNPALRTDEIGIAEGVQSKWLSTIRARIGFLPAPAWMIYATGGLAIANVKFADAAVFAHSDTFNAAGNDDTRTGWTAGGGVEWMFMPKWSLKLEGLFVDLGNVNFVSINSLPAVFPNSTIAHRHSFTETIARAGINFHF
jgi:outer membrane immunogenic protein